MPSSVQNAFHNLAENCGPLSETMSVDIPCNLTTCRMGNCTVSDAEGSFVRGRKCTALDNLSIIVRIVVLWLDVGSPVTKSSAMCDQGL